MFYLCGLAVAVALIVLGLFLFTRFVALRIRLGLPPEGRFITVMGNRVHYVEQGRGDETILLIHGLNGVSQHFSSAVLGQLARDYRVVAIDRPGSGYSVRPAGSSASLAVQADVVAAVIDALQLGKPLLVGHSLGGAVALATALRHPDHVRGLALIAPLTQLPSAGPPAAFAALAIRPAWLCWLFTRTLAIPLAMRQRDKVMKAVFGPERMPAAFPMRGGGLLSMHPSHLFAASNDLAALDEVLPRMQARYAGLALPIRILYGRQDRILDPLEQGQGLVELLPAVELELIDGGHMLPVTQPQVVADFIRRSMPEG